MANAAEIHCRCGKVRLALGGAPMLGAKCHCASCRAAAERLQALPDSSPMVEADGGTPFVMYRKDRVQFVEGTEQLAEFRLTPTSSTRRVMATCCNTPMFLEFEHGHWLSLYAQLWPDAQRPRSDIRTMTNDMPEGATLSQEIPYGTRQTWGFYGKLLWAWAAMGFRTPQMPDVTRKVDV